MSQILAALAGASFDTRLTDVRHWPSAAATAIHSALGRREAGNLVAFARLEADPA